MARRVENRLEGLVFALRKNVKDLSNGVASEFDLSLLKELQATANTVQSLLSEAIWEVRTKL